MSKLPRICKYCGKDITFSRVMQKWVTGRRAWKCPRLHKQTLGHKPLEPVEPRKPLELPIVEKEP